MKIKNVRPKNCRVWIFQEKNIAGIEKWTNEIMTERD